MRYPDLAVVLVYLAGITWFGARFRHAQRTLKDYFLGGRNAPWWAISLSIVSAETSTLTIIGTPTLAFAGNLGFLQVVFGYLLARIVISFLFLPHYFRGEMYTAYELMGRRFGPRLRKLTAGTFLVIRALAEGVRVFAISIVISIVLGTGEIASIVVILCLTLFYTFEGGMTAVIWTDVVQMCLYVLGAFLSFFVILQHIPGGWGGVLALAVPAGKFHLFDFSLPAGPEFFTRTYTFWAGLIGGCFLTTASHGTEQLMVQRLLAARSQAQSRAALLASWVVIFLLFSLFLVIGVVLFVFYTQSHLAPPQPADRLYPAFVWHYLPPGLAGLVVAAILAAAMSNLSAALNALASTTIMDFYQPLKRRRGGVADSDARSVRLARAATVVWGVILFGVGCLARQWGSVLEAGLSIASIAYGGLLGVFLLGILTRRVGEKAAMAGMMAGFAVMIYVKFFTPIAWTWYVVIGTGATFLVGLLNSRAWKEAAGG
jgi:SSS family solute:Na+ symporter